MPSLFSLPATLVADLNTLKSNLDSELGSASELKISTYPLSNATIPSSVTSYVDDLVSKSEVQQEPQFNSSTSTSPTCMACGHIPSIDESDLRSHFKTDWHRYNLKLKLRYTSNLNDFKPLTEEQFEELTEVSSIEASGDENEEEDEEEYDGDDVHEDEESEISSDKNILEPAQRKITKRIRDINLNASHDLNNTDDDGDEISTHRNNQSQSTPFVAFPLPVINEATKSQPKQKFLLVYKQVLYASKRKGVDQCNDSSSELIGKVLSLQQKSSKRSEKSSAAEILSNGSFWTLMMLGAGHFAAALIATGPDAKVLIHKTFHRYTTRRKQGGAQSRFVFSPT